ncbi:hypothetical protein BWI17_12605 [Betaproteobacteria bacterium GR16-43]|nr:hypothetical protein BWI17_12605 [Betaproteobacteria bacterium GR16-43]
MRFFIESIGVLAPGLSGWEDTRAVALGEKPLVCTPLSPPAPQCLPAAERRRSGVTARLAIAAAEQALAGSSIAADRLSMVFAASEAAGEITHQLCEVLAGTREVSPTTFHNSVHNAPMGYLSIAIGARRSGTSICRGPWTLAAGLVCSALELEATREPVLFACYDSPLAPPMRASLPVVEPTALAFVLSAARTERTIAECAIASVPSAGEPRWPAWVPEAWRPNPSALGFIVLAALAAPGGSARVPLAPDQDLEIRC